MFIVNVEKLYDATVSSPYSSRNVLIVWNSASVTAGLSFPMADTYLAASYLEEPDTLFKWIYRADLQHCCALACSVEKCLMLDKACLKK